MSTTITSQLARFTKTFTAAQTAAAVDGEYYDLPGVTVYQTYTHPLPEKGRVEVNVTTPAAAAAFEWATEITINDKVEGRFIHLIVRPDGSCAETYGKTVLPISEERGAEILRILQELTSRD